MENKRNSLLPNMALSLGLILICMFNLHPAMSQEPVSAASWSSEEGMEFATESKAEDLSSSALETYIVHVNLPEGGVTTQSQELDTFYSSFLPKTTNSNEKSRLVYSYTNVLSGFAAKLSPQEAKAMETREGFVSARPQKVYKLRTTHSPNFLGLHQNLGFWRGSNFGKGVIVGLLDTGITPGHPSFDDKGVPPPPAKWKGKCELDGAVCNNKLIGARNFISGDTGPPVDDEGHGTHTASTAAGNVVEDANVFGNANGTASGMAPLAHLAIYKVCGPDNCAESDMLAAMDTAVEDGVDILSLSIGGEPEYFDLDGIAIGAFGAMEKGIFVSCSAGNSGPFNASMENGAPWILTVGASTIDRKILATALLGSKDTFDGESLFQPKDFPSTLLPLVYPGMNGDEDAAFCAEGSLNSTDVKGKVVICDRGANIARIAKGQAVKNAGGAAMILVNQALDGDSTLADPHVLPATHIGYAAGQKIKAYISSTPSPQATVLFKGTIIGVDSAPEVTSFSSRGPNVVSPGILKPDIIGPGVSILAAWPVSVDNNTHETATFNMISGTSMSCPHLSGIVALLKSAHPTWSPAAIKSAIMTTADLLNLNNLPIVDETGQQADLFAIGAGHVNPSRANDPGLIYDLDSEDYIGYLCSLGYGDKRVGIIARHNVSCSNVSSISELELNYPSFSTELGAVELGVTRTVTSVGEQNETYTVEITQPPGVSVSVSPTQLEISTGEKQLYRVFFSLTKDVVNTTYVQGYLKWSSAKHSVRSPISIKLNYGS